MKFILWSYQAKKRYLEKTTKQINKQTSSVQKEYFEELFFQGRYMQVFRSQTCGFRRKATKIQYLFFNIDFCRNPLTTFMTNIAVKIL